MRCHYEVLEVSRGAEADELKKQYRKMALRWHPDKNRDNLEEAEHRIKEINAAYEVLSDPNERAWYDDHRDAILRGGDGTAGADGTESMTPNLWTYFRSSCFEGFEDDDNGFYAVYRRAFEEIMKVEIDSGVGNVDPMPGFGTSASSDEDVDNFYSRWSSFTSKLSFGWADLYNPNEAVNRYQRRLIDKENQKARNSERRTYNDQVRSLVNYAKKRDKRVLLLEVARQKERERRERERLAALDEKKRLRREAREQWMQTYEEDMAQQLAEAEASGKKLFRLADEHDEAEAEARAQAESDDELVVWHCEACTKDFKSEKQLRNHENSKKHKEALKKMQKNMQKEEKLLQEAMEREQAALEAEMEAQMAALELQESNAGVEGVDNGEDESENASDASEGEVDGEHVEGEESEQSEEDSDDSDSEPDFGAFGNFARDDSSDEEEEESESEEEDNKVTSDSSPKQDQDDKDKDGDGDDDGESENDEDAEDGGDDDVEPPLAPAATSGTKSAGSKKKNAASGKSSGVSAEKTDHFCVVCSTYFTSRNKLFQHIAATNHAVAPDAVKAIAKGKSKKGKKKGKGRS